MCKVFVLLTYRTSSDIVGNPALHALPDQVILGLLKGFVPSGVSCCWVVIY